LSLAQQFIESSPETEPRIAFISWIPARAALVPGTKGCEISLGSSTCHTREGGYPEYFLGLWEESHATPQSDAVRKEMKELAFGVQRASFTTRMGSHNYLLHDVARCAGRTERKDVTS